MIINLNEIQSIVTWPSKLLNKSDVKMDPKKIVWNDTIIAEYENEKYIYKPEFARIDQEYYQMPRVDISMKNTNQVVILYINKRLESQELMDHFEFTLASAINLLLIGELDTMGEAISKKETSMYTPLISVTNLNILINKTLNTIA